MKKLLLSFVDNITKILAVIAIVSVFQIGKSCEESKRDEIVRSKIRDKSDEIVKLSRAIEFYQLQEYNLKNTIALFNKKEHSPKIQELEKRKLELEHEQFIKSNLIRKLKDSIHGYHQDQIKLIELNQKIKQKEKRISEIRSELEETKVKLKGLKETIGTITVQNFQLTKDLSETELKFESLSESIRYLQEAHHYEQQADECESNKKLLLLFQAYQSYEMARKKNVFRKDDLWRVICKMNKIDKDGDRWRITIKGVTHQIQSSLYKDMLQIKNLTRRNNKTVKG